MHKSRSPNKQSIVSGPISEDKLKIIIRLRPIINEEEPAEFVKLQNDNTLQIRRPGNYTYMKFNNIVPPHLGQKEVFTLIQDSIKQFLTGTNITIFAYGQTGAGKTYSIIGNYSPQQSTQNLFNFLSSKQRGVLSRALEMIMKHISSCQQDKPTVSVSFFEIYNEKIYDLYNNTLIPLEIRQSKNGQISIPDLMNVQVNNMQDAIQYLLVGLKNRVTGCTHANAKSSRSHSIFQINIEREDQSGNKISSSLRIVDLAGSQKFKIPSDLSPAQKQIRIQQLTNINSSLSCLGHCISALIEKSRTHIPFRNSKLTRILSDSLLGQGKMRFIICISPSISASAQTFSTLQFANRAKKAIFQRSDSKTPQMSKKKSQNEEIISLRRQLEKQKEARLFLENQLQKLYKNKPQQLLKENKYLKKQNQKLKEQIRNLMTKNNKVSNEHSHHNYKQEENKQNTNFKQQIINLPIFQKNKQLIQHGNSQNINKNVMLNRKKAQFQKKIKKFIEADSPVNKQGDKNKKHHKSVIQQYSFQGSRSDYDQNYDINQYNQQNNEIEDSNDLNEQIWNSSHNDTHEFIQKACNKMNLPEFTQLKNEMERARQQLFNLRKKDNEIQMKKHLIQ